MALEVDLNVDMEWRGADGIQANAPHASISKRQLNCPFYVNSCEHAHATFNVFETRTALAPILTTLEPKPSGEARPSLASRKNASEPCHHLHLVYSVTCEQAG